MVYSQVETFGWITNTLPNLNSEFTPEKWRFEDDPFLLGFGSFWGAMLTSGGYIE